MTEVLWFLMDFKNDLAPEIYDYKPRHDASSHSASWANL